MSDEKTWRNCAICGGLAARIEELEKRAMDAEAERDRAWNEAIEAAARIVFERICDLIEAQPQDGISAEGIFSASVKNHQRQFAGGMRQARISATAAIRSLAKGVE